MIIRLPLHKHVKRCLCMLTVFLGKIFNPFIKQFDELNAEYYAICCNLNLIFVPFLSIRKLSWKLNSTYIYIFLSKSTNNQIARNFFKYFLPTKLKNQTTCKLPHCISWWFSFEIGELFTYHSENNSRTARSFYCRRKFPSQLIHKVYSE